LDSCANFLNFWAAAIHLGPMRAYCFAVVAGHKLNKPSNMFEIKTGAGKPKYSVVTGIVMCVLAASAGLAQTNSSAWEWTNVSPESQGMSSKKLQAMTEALAARSTSGLLVIRNDKIVCEWYAPGAGPTTPHGTASMAKAIVGGVALAVGITDGRVALNDKAAKFIPQWQGDPRKSRITFLQLGSHTSGLADAEADGLSHDKLSGWQGDFWKRLEPPRDPFTISRDITPTIFEPGEQFQYSNPGIGMLMYALTAALKDAPQRDIRTLLRERVMRPIGVPDREWSAGYNQTFTVDGLALVAAWGGGNYTARAVARIGRLMLRQGNWEGKQLLSPEAVRLVTSDVGTPGPCGVGWWSNNEGVCARLPKDAYWGAGAGHQTLLVVPSLKLIAVRNGRELAKLPKDGADTDYARPTYKWLFEPLAEAIAAQ
jgi:CubicO group peptidase (beta-lactamase class C family)